MEMFVGNCKINSRRSKEKNKERDSEVSKLGSKGKQEKRSKQRYESKH